MKRVVKKSPEILTTTKKALRPSMQSENLNSLETKVHADKTRMLYSLSLDS